MSSQEEEKAQRMPEAAHTKRNTRAFEALLEPVLEPAYGTAYRMTRNHEEAEDLVQETAVRAFRAFDTFQQGTNFKAWFFRILINVFRNRYRKRRREPTIRPLDDAPELYMYVQSSNTGLLAQNANPAALIISKMTEAQIKAAIEALPEDYQVVSILYFMEEISYQEIADILDCPIGTVRSRLHRGRKLLQKALWEVAQEQNVIATVGAEIGSH